MPGVTSKDVAKQAGVSRTTVSLVLNDVGGARISDATRRRVIETARALKYRPNALAQSLKTRRSRMIGLIVPSITNPFFSSIAQGVEDLAIASGYNVFLCNSFRDPEKEAGYVRALVEKQADGIVFASMCESVEAINELRASGMAVVAFDRRIETADVDTVLIDNVKGGEIATRYLIQLGHRKIAFVSGPLRVPSRADRLLGYRKAMSSAGFPEASAIVFEGHVEQENQDTSYEFEVGCELARDMTESRPDVTAVFAVNDMTALGVIKFLKRSGIAVPRDISVIGFDDILLAGSSEPGLTTVAQPKYEMGRAAAELLLSRIEQPGRAERKNLVFTPELVRRESCGPPPERGGRERG